MRTLVVLALLAGTLAEAQTTTTVFGTIPVRPRRRQRAPGLRKGNA